MIIAQETVTLKAKKEFHKIEQGIRQATIEGERIDVIEENLWERMLNLGRLMLTSFVAGQGTGDLGVSVGIGVDYVVNIGSTTHIDKVPVA